MPVAGPFYFAWCESTATTFGSEHLVMDEYIFSIRRSLIEGEKPLLEIEMKNPRIGLLNPARKYWAWLAYDDGGGPQPLFFGRLVGNPVQLFEEVIEVQMVASPADYKHRRQMVAKDMKVLPYFDPVFVEVAKRDDPDKIIEAYGKLWDVDPITHSVSAVSVTDGSDGNIDLDEDDHFYDSMSTTVSEPPAFAILMDATVPWTQSARGTVNLGNHSVLSMSDAVRSEWPKPLTQLGGGWSVFESSALEVGGADTAMSVSTSWSWQSRSKKHANGDTLSLSYSQTMPMGPVIYNQVLTQVQQSGVIDPFAVDEDGDPSPLNIPSSFSQTSVHALQYSIQTTLTTEYIAERPRTERVIFTVVADTQPIMVDPVIDTVTETMTITGTDVSVPIISPLNWTSVAGQFVEVGQIVFPDDAQMPGGRTAQICIDNGTAGTTPPNFSDIPGYTTVDGTVTWSSLGVAEPSDNAGDWLKNNHFNLGDIILPRRPLFARLNNYIAPGLQQFPPQSTTIPEGTYLQDSSGNFSTITAGGIYTTGGTFTGTAVNVTLPSGKTFYICTQAGQTGPTLPPFNEVLHSVTVDNTVRWSCIGTGEIPVGGVPGQIHAPSYFTQDRGMRSLEYLALLVRARLLWRARCVEISFDTDWNTGKAITTRKTVTLHDPRIAGGLVVGKVKSAVLSFGDSGAAVCRVTIGCMVGKDNAVADNPGTPTYVDEGYVGVPYQKFDSVVTLLPTGSDIAYAVPSYKVTDDGLVFPLTYQQVVLKNNIERTGDMFGAVNSALKSMAEAAQYDVSPFRAFTSGDPFNAAFANEKAKQMILANSVQRATTENPIWVEIQLKPVNAGPFHAVYNVRFSNLTMARGIDLQSEVET